jgi:hypothetical protein
MSKHGWMLWLAPVAAWAVYMCWLTGFQTGYDAGHTDGWATARKAFMPSSSVVLDRVVKLHQEPALDDDADAVPLPQ